MGKKRTVPKGFKPTLPGHSVYELELRKPLDAQVKVYTREEYGEEFLKKLVPERYER